MIGKVNRLTCFIPYFFNTASDIFIRQTNHSTHASFDRSCLVCLLTYNSTIQHQFQAILQSDSTCNNQRSKLAERMPRYHIGNNLLLRHSQGNLINKHRWLGVFGFHQLILCAIKHHICDFPTQKIISTVK